VVDTLVRVNQHKDQIRGLRLTYAPELMRHFTARLEMLS